MRRLLFCVVAIVTVLAPLSGAVSGAPDNGRQVVSSAVLNGSAAADGGVMALAANASANAEARTVTPQPGVPVWLNGKELRFSRPSAMVNGTLFVPTTFFSELGLGSQCVGDCYIPTAWKAYSDETTAEFQAGVPTMKLDGAQTALPEAPYLDDDWLFVPLRASAEAFGYIVRWDELKHAVALEKEWDALPAVGTIEKLQELLRGAEAEFGSGQTRVMVTGDAATAAGSSDSDTGGAPAGSTAGDGATVSKSSSASASAAPQAVDDDYSRTNVQVNGVDEGDLVKTDGSYLYQVSGRRLMITQLNPASQLRIASSVTFDDERFTPRELYVDGDKLVAIGRAQKPLPKDAAVTRDAGEPAVRAQPEQSAQSTAAGQAPMIKIFPLGTAVTRAIVYDISDRSAPNVLRTIELDGNAIATRKIGAVIYLTANAPAYGYKAAAGGSPVTPSYRDTASGEEWRNIELPNIRYFPGPNRPNYLLIGGFDLSQPDKPLLLSSFFGAGQNVYVSDKSMYVTQTNYAGGIVRPLLTAPAQRSMTSASGVVDEPDTTVYRFKLGSGSVRFAAQGSVSGTPLNQFSMDEYNGVLRIATSGGQSNALYTMDESMQTIGRLEKLAPGERIYSARFMGGRAYLVTFKQVDPLFAIDVSNPRSPVVLGALKIPGYSDYLHPYDATHLIGFGKDTVLDGTSGTALNQGMKLSLFDVSDVTHPVELFKTSIGDRGTESELLHDHKALLFSRDKGLLSFPVSVREVQLKDGYKDPHQYGSLTFQGAYVYQIDLQEGFKLRGRVTHVTAEEQPKSGYDSFDPAYLVRRTLYVGDTLYTVSDGAVKANDLAALNELGLLRFGK